ncbi:hypothetical protein PtrSN002B_011874 [Pyrenophora tritici-repentis]|uniref:Uncharacterized protein n=1 Tax=Pyrenophora tritici-repentis TaxID=45151 RepID=A0A2W1EIU5_9PLEO|nr:hypothetical protein PtrV1_08547 [Pyrenophora tritici-repentis]KAF7449585.1 hypothetical protein A1F99_066340 [Pyrenophora tritici-repentis]KAF7570297.1 hypothetical protein PtrM4_102990 [Pyrenophora tritici-repentis]KAG9383476.1 hypothetical protein A1F94_005387 [Pyrenophora tritici-repentis]KAI0573253.1 hypothetical protein Alg215_09308 [Pyrenophora tritici-repentis]
MSEQVSFFTLSRELRDMIYKFYLIGDGGGYSLNQQSGKLVTAEGHLINLALAYTCKTVASEMRNLPLQLNAIHITTTNDAERFYGSIYHFRFLSKLQAFYRNELPLVAQSCIDEQVLDEVRAVYPHMLPILHAIQQGHRNPHRLDGSWGEVPSMYRQWVAGILKLISKRPDFKHMISRTALKRLELSVDEIINMDQTPWVLPSETHLNEMSRALLGNPAPPGIDEGELYRQSAATVAI